MNVIYEIIGESPQSTQSQIDSAYITRQAF